jgi:hypothetical protein
MLQASSSVQPRNKNRDRRPGLSRTEQGTVLREILDETKVPVPASQERE